MPIEDFFLSKNKSEILFARRTTFSSIQTIDGLLIDFCK